MFGAAHGNERFRFLLEQDRGVEHPVLLGSREFFAVEEQNGLFPLVDDFQLRDVFPLPLLR